MEYLPENTQKFVGKGFNLEPNNKTKFKKQACNIISVI